MTSLYKPTTLIAALLLAAAPAFAATMAKGEYSAEKDKIKATYGMDKKACDGMSGNAKDVCHEEAKGKEKVALADLEFRYTGKADDGTKLAKAKAEAVYEVAKERCDDQSGDAKKACVATAKQEYERARPN